MAVVLLQTGHANKQFYIDPNVGSVHSLLRQLHFMSQTFYAGYYIQHILLSQSPSRSLHMCVNK